jgi:hypothetical protein
MHVMIVSITPFTRFMFALRRPRRLGWGVDLVYLICFWYLVFWFQPIIGFEGRCLVTLKFSVCKIWPGVWFRC